MEGFARRSQRGPPELVSNAIRHGEGPVRIQLQLRGKCLRIGVHDDGSALPVSRQPGADGGFGLGLVEEFCVRSHTDPIANDGKTVWCEHPATDQQ